MLKLHHIFLLNFIALLFVTFTLILGVSYYYIKTIDIESLKSSMPRDLSLVETVIQNQKTNMQIDQIAHKIKEDTGIRITITDDNGTVIVETEKSPKEMESHANRPEIMQAMGESVGVSVRRSKTTGKDYIYYAKKIEIGGQSRFLRIAYPTSITEIYLYSVWFKIVMVFLFSIIIAAIYSYKVNKKIESQISQITEYLTAIEAKEFKAEIRPAFAAEFFSIARMLKILAVKLEKKERQKRKYTAKLKLKNRQTTEIIEAISHEFKNPVSAIMGYTETLISDPNLDRKISEKFLEKVYKNSQTISAMIDRLSLSLKLENDTLSPTFEEFWLLSVAEDAKNQLAHKYIKRKININGQNIKVYADKTMIKLTIVNLMENALKYSEEEIIVSITDTGEHAKVEVRDFGIGIPERELENITQKFYRLSKNSWDNSLGLGLSLVCYVLKLHGSALEIQSSLAVGSTFSFKIKKSVELNEEHSHEVETPSEPFN